MDLYKYHQVDETYGYSANQIFWTPIMSEKDCSGVTIRSARCKYDPKENKYYFPTVQTTTSTSSSGSSSSATSNNNCSCCDSSANTSGTNSGSSSSSDTPSVSYAEDTSFNCYQREVCLNDILRRKRETAQSPNGRYIDTKNEFVMTAVHTGVMTLAIISFIYYGVQETFFSVPIK